MKTLLMKLFSSNSSQYKVNVFSEYEEVELETSKQRNITHFMQVLTSSSYLLYCD